MLDRAKAHMVVIGHSQVDEVDCFETFAPMISATS